MPLVLKAKANGQDAQWRGLDYSNIHGLLIWNDGSHIVAGSEIVPDKIENVAQQAEILVGNYAVFAYETDFLLDVEHRTSARLLNERGDKPDFSKKTLDRGWLSPQGQFVGCDYGNHADLLQYTIGITGSQAKQEGWVMVYPEMIISANKDIALSEQQVTTLKALGFSGHQRNENSIPPYSSDFEAHRQRYIATRRHGDAPLLIPPKEAQAIIRNVREALKHIANIQIQQICRVSVLRAGILREDFDRQAAAIGDGNRMVVDTMKYLRTSLDALREPPPALAA